MDSKVFVRQVAIGASKAILAVLFVGAVVVAPGGVAGTMEVVQKFFAGERVDPREEEKVRRALRYLRSKKLIDVQRQYQKEVFSLTKLGYFKARKLMRSFGIPKPKKWDGKWRLVVFDIPHLKKDKSDWFRSQLKNLGFANIQKSIWVHPYECRDQVFFLTDIAFIKPYVRYVVAEEVTGGKDLRRRFEI